MSYMKISNRFSSFTHKQSLDSLLFVRCQDSLYRLSLVKQLSTEENKLPNPIKAANKKRWAEKSTSFKIEHLSKQPFLKNALRMVDKDLPVFRPRKFDSNTKPDLSKYQEPSKLLLNRLFPKPEGMSPVDYKKKQERIKWVLISIPVILTLLSPFAYVKWERRNSEDSVINVKKFCLEVL